MKHILLLIVIFIALSGFQSSQKPKILIIGDSISIGYYPHVQEDLEERATTKHNPGNAEHTATGLKKIHEWLDTDEWDVIVFNWGLWDLCYRHPESTVYGNRDKTNGQITHTIEEYAKNLEALVKILKNSQAKLLFVNTSYIPPLEAGRVAGDDLKYNEVAEKIMTHYQIPVIDLNSPSRKIHRKHGKGKDDVHYTDMGYQKLARHIVKRIKKELKD
jgi:lysophospholipase L1-like esterase